jgi:aryl-alcohol dehydrogenase-like predicted oxidoreductase
MSSQIHRLALGTASFGLPGYGLSSGSRPTHAESAEMLRYAFGRGVRWFDTAAAYGDAEDLLAVVRSGLDWTIGAPKCSTKLAPQLVKMGVCREGRFDAVLLHNPTVGELSDRELLRAFGVSCEADSDYEHGHDASLPGASTYAPDEAEAAITAGAKIIQLPFHALDQRHARAGVFEAARAAGCLVMARQPWARGLLTHGVVVPALCAVSRAGLPEDDALGVVDLLVWYQCVCARHNISPREAGLRFSLESPADLVVFGVSSMAQLVEDIAIAESAPPPSWPACYADLLSTFADSGLTLGSVCTAGR